MGGCWRVLRRIFVYKKEEINEAEKSNIMKSFIIYDFLKI
jgi:hypothetical protein